MAQVAEPVKAPIRTERARCPLTLLVLVELSDHYMRAQLRPNKYLVALIAGPTTACTRVAHGEVSTRRVQDALVPTRLTHSLALISFQIAILVRAALF